jgi:hypothetical protein
MTGACLDRERGELASVMLGALSNPTGLEPMRYDARVLTRGKQGVSKKQHDLPFIILLE